MDVRSQPSMQLGPQQSLMQPTSLAQPYPTAQAPPQSTGDERPLKRLRASPGQLHADCARQNVADNANIPSLHASFAQELRVRDGERNAASAHYTSEITRGDAEIAVLRRDLAAHQAQEQPHSVDRLLRLPS